MTACVSSRGYVTDVISTMLASIAYSTSTETLWVEYKSNGEVYEYLNVPTRLAEAFRTAGSHGKFVNDQIKPSYLARKGTVAEYLVFCDAIRIQSTLVPIVNIDWAAVTAHADHMVWDRC